MAYYDIEMYEMQNIKSKYLFDKVILDVVSKDWSNKSMRETTVFLGFLSKLTHHEFFDEASIKIVLNNFPAINRYNNLNELSSFIGQIINCPYCSPQDIQTIYEMFSQKSVLILETIAKCSKTPTDILIKLFYSDQYSVVVAIGENKGPEAYKLLKLPEFSQRVSSAKRIINRYN